MSNDPSLWIPVAPGELLDKIAILTLKSQRLLDERQRRNVAVELALLEKVRADHIPDIDGLSVLMEQLRGVNADLWDIENAIRTCEREQEFGPRFVALARSVYQGNARRAALKRSINVLLGSPIVEEKYYDDGSLPRE